MLFAELAELIGLRVKGDEPELLPTIAELTLRDEILSDAIPFEWLIVVLPVLLDVPAEPVGLWVKGKEPALLLMPVETLAWPEMRLLMPPGPLAQTLDGINVPAAARVTTVLRKAFVRLVMIHARSLVFKGF